MDVMHTWRSGEGWDSPTWPSANDGLADITRWHYHEATGLLESKEDAQSQQAQYTYFEGGRLHTRIWARNSASLVTTYSYDPNNGELTGIDYSDTTPDIGFTYNRTGQRSTVTDAVGSRSFTYNTALQPETETLTGLISRTITRSYDTTTVPGRNTGFNTDSSYAVTYGYDNTGRFGGVSWNVGTHSDSATYARVPDSHLLHTTTFASGGVITNSYEPNRNLRIGVKNEYGSSTVSQYDYVYDNIGRRTSATMTGEAFSVSLPVPPDQNLINTDTYTSVSYTPNSLNQYNEVNNDGSVINPTHDEDGNLTDDARLTYVWNGENRLASATPKNPVSGDKKIELLYDYMGRRVRKITTTWDGSTWQPDETALFVYDGWNMIEELDGAGSTTASYVHGLDLSQSIQGAGGIGGILARIDHGTDKVHLYFFDANGNVGQLIDIADGSVVAAYEYAPFGGLTSAAGSYAEVNPFRFSSKYADDTTGLYYYGYRYYSPDTGRWLSRDPIGEEGGLNLYGFVRNDGINDTDPKGLSSTHGGVLQDIKTISASSYNGLSDSLKREYISFFVGVSIKARTVYDALPTLYPVEFNFFYEYGIDNYYNICRFKETGMSGFAELWSNFKDFAAQKANSRFNEGLKEYAEFLYGWTNDIPVLGKFKSLYDSTQLDHQALESETIQLMIEPNLINEDTFQNLFNHSTTYYINMNN
ncbi:MAG: RHS repeat-associated core domain-containing protein [Candidatus Electrothrix sp. GW3-4]|uniref:RHS repeat-associated core domain-containing protein n=1 Tax=Candidatus Electrothrix sp. GW3-4 TaxID=3126740 RepID=UPI0030CE3D18